MALWLLYRKGLGGFDEYNGFVVRAPNEAKARKLAAEIDTSDSKRWELAALTTCERLSAGGKAGVILDSFTAG